MKKIGIYNPYLETRGGGEKVCLALASELTREKHHVTLIVHAPIDLKQLGKYLDVDTTGIHTQVVKLSRLASVVHRLPLVPQGIKNFFSDLTTYWIMRRKNYDLFVNNCIDSSLPNPSKVGVYACMFPHPIRRTPSRTLLKEIYHSALRGLYRLLLHPGKKHGIDTYDLITANSQYSQGYIKQLWGLESKILYPICDDMKDSGPLKKDKLIINVGRFFAKTDVNHHKRQDFMIENFVRLKKLHAEGWELHLIGSVAEDADALRYILDLFKKAQGYPVFFHFNAPRADVKQLYNRASVYWHATGYGSDAKKYPQKQEHFGIVTVEAMSAGCIPVVINSAGQRESVRHGEDGYLWQTPEELQRYTTKVATLSPSEGKKLRTNAMQSAKRFNQGAFNKQVETIFDEVLN